MARLTGWMWPILAGGMVLSMVHSQPKNQAEAMEIDWQRAFYGTLDGKKVLLFNSTLAHGKLTFGDLNGDGRLDFLVGKENGRIALFLNEGTSEKPAWRLNQEEIKAQFPRPGENQKIKTGLDVIDVGNHAAPALVDIDLDGDLDLFVGSGDGRFFFFKNIGNPLLPSFFLVRDDSISRDFGNRLVPFFADVNQDRLPDLLVGNQKGEVYLMINEGSRSRREGIICRELPAADPEPEEKFPCKIPPRRLLSIGKESNAAPAMVDWDGDGDLDLFVGKSDGTIAYYENKGDAFNGDWRLAQRRFLAIDEGGFAAPVFLEANGDGKPDMLIGSSTDLISLYTYKGTGNPLDVWKVTGNWLDNRRIATDQSRVVLTSGDLDGDKDLDLILGNGAGSLIRLENTGTPAKPAWTPVTGNVLAKVTRKNSAPWLADLDGDGDLDLLVGGIDGQLWLLRNRGGPKAAKFVLETTRFEKIDVGNDSIPVTIDIDGDVDLDLFVGNRNGFVIFYRNIGSASSPKFRKPAKFGNVSGKRNAAPGFFDWNGDQQVDLVVGSRGGFLILNVNKNPPKSVELKAWEPLGKRWGPFSGDGFSVPHFADLNQDGRPDLLLADGQGNIQLWWNRGRAPPSKRETASVKGGGESEPDDTANDIQNALATAALTPDAPDTLSGSGLKDLSQPAATNGEQGAAVSAILSQPRETTGPIDPELVLVSRNFAGIKVEGRSAPTFGDIDGDGDLDLVVGGGKGALELHRNVGTRKKPAWKLEIKNLAGYEGGDNPSPLLVDLDGDQKVDLIVGTENGRLLFYRNTGKTSGDPFQLVQGALAGINVRRNAVPSVVRINGDSLPDLLVGNLAGTLFAYLRDPTAQSLNFKLEDRRFLRVDVGIASTPFVGDIDRDKAPDLLIGSDQGKITFFTRGRGREKPTSSGWSRGKAFFKSLKFPFASRPVLADVDGDGDMDLFLGTEKGTIFYYRNDAVKAE